MRSANHVLSDLQGYDLYEQVWVFFEGIANAVHETRAAEAATLILFPNPAGDEVYTHPEGRYSICDLSGRILRQGETDESGKVYLNGLARGRYLFTLQTDQNCYKALLLKR